MQVMNANILPQLFALKRVDSVQMVEFVVHMFIIVMYTTVVIGKFEEETVQ
jgi:hypothetical protein